LKTEGLTRHRLLKLFATVLTTSALPDPLSAFTNNTTMTNSKHFDLIIIGGSYAGLSAAMALGRALRKVLIIDSGKPCNAQTPYSHNFLTQDGKTPAQIAMTARDQVGQYKTIEHYSGLATSGKQTGDGFEITTASGKKFTAKKLIFATGVRDIMPATKGFAASWGISIIHCPYCHGYEVRNQKTGIIGNGDAGFELSKEIYNWTKDLTLFTNGKSNLSKAQSEKLKEKNIAVVETEVQEYVHRDGQLQHVVLRDGRKVAMKAIYARPSYEQHCTIPQTLGCALTEEGHVKVDMFQRTTVEGIFACGDNATPLRSLSNAVAMGTTAGAMANKALVADEF
jgi:thioredoxin reductase